MDPGSGSWWRPVFVLLRMTLAVMAAAVIMSGCGDDIPDDLDLRREIQEFVVGISEYARSSDPQFIVIPQNGIELATLGWAAGDQVYVAYLEAIDGHGQEDLFYGYSRDDRATPSDETAYLRDYLDKSLEKGKVILVTDYCSTHSNMDDSYAQNQSAGYVSFAAPVRELDRIPDYPDPVHLENDAEIGKLQDVRNFLYLINPGSFDSKGGFIQAICATNYDLLIMDLFFTEQEVFSDSDVLALKSKANGGSRLVVAYMSIGEAEDYRYYWDSAWENDPPDWLDGENPDWEGNYKVRYWEAGWQEIIFGGEHTYLDMIMEAGFDGVYLDIIDAYEYYE